MKQSLFSTVSSLQSSVVYYRDFNDRNITFLLREQFKYRLKIKSTEMLANQKQSISGVHGVLWSPSTPVKFQVHL